MTTTNYEQILGWTTEKLEFDAGWRETIIVQPAVLQTSQYAAFRSA
jgi:hypothetical protein